MYQTPFSRHVDKTLKRRVINNLLFAKKCNIGPRFGRRWYICVPYFEIFWQYLLKNAKWGLDFAHNKKKECIFAPKIGEIVCLCVRFANAKTCTHI